MEDFSFIDNSKTRYKRRREMLRELFAEFSKRFSSEAACLQEIYERLYRGSKICCRHCNSTSVLASRNLRMVKCSTCNKLTWITAGTFFHRIRKGSPWLFTLWCFEKGIQLNSVELKNLVGIAQSSALNILKKVGIVIESLMDNAVCVVPCIKFDEIICKRSRQTPANQHPRSENSDSEPFELESPSLDPSYLGLSTEERDVYDLLSLKPESIESLCQNSTKKASHIISMLTMLQLKGLVKQDYGERYSRANLSSTQLDSKKSTEMMMNSEAEVECITSQIKSICHGISRKYLQIYIAISWFVRRESGRRGCDLVSFCLNHRKIHDAQIMLYSSPELVRISVIRG